MVWGSYIKQAIVKLVNGYPVLLRFAFVKRAYRQEIKSKIEERERWNKGIRDQILLLAGMQQTDKFRDALQAAATGEIAQNYLDDLSVQTIVKIDELLDYHYENSSDLGLLYAAKDNAERVENDFERKEK